MKQFFEISGAYFLMLHKAIRKPDKWWVFWSRFWEEVDKLGVKSLGIITILSVFMGAVIVIQTGTNFDTPLVPRYLIGFAVRQSIVLEFSPTIISLILAGKVGSNIASEIGSMRVTEQIDALEIMGVNSASYLILPKIAASIFINPFLIINSMFLGVIGGWVAGIGTGLVSSVDYIDGLLLDFESFSITYAVIKTIVFAFIITSISAFNGYYTKGGALEVGASSTKSVVQASILILISNYILTQIMLI